MNQNSQMDQLLNDYQYDKKGFLKACDNAGIDHHKAESFCNDVYARLQMNDGGIPASSAAVVRGLIMAIALIAVIIIGSAVLYWALGSVIAKIPPMP